MKVFIAMFQKSEFKTQSEFRKLVYTEGLTRQGALDVMTAFSSTLSKYGVNGTTMYLLPEDSALMMLEQPKTECDKADAALKEYE